MFLRSRAHSDAEDVAREGEDSCVGRVRRRDGARVMPFRLPLRESFAALRHRASRRVHRVIKHNGHAGGGACLAVTIIAVLGLIEDVVVIGIGMAVELLADSEADRPKEVEVVVVEIIMAAEICGGGSRRVGVARYSPRRTQLDGETCESTHRT